jgi:hypothetical protein
MEIVTKILILLFLPSFSLSFYFVFGYETVPINMTYALFLKHVSIRWSSDEQPAARHTLHHIFRRSITGSLEFQCFIADTEMRSSLFVYF